MGALSMRIFLDTSVLVAACLSKHPHHARARPVLERVSSGKDVGLISARKAGPERVYTFNTRHFQALALDPAGIICAP